MKRLPEAPEGSRPALPCDRARYPEVRQLVPHDDANRVMLYEVYANAEAFEAHWNGPSKQQANQDMEGLKISASGVRCNIID